LDISLKGYRCSLPGLAGSPSKEIPKDESSTYPYAGGTTEKCRPTTLAPKLGKRWALTTRHIHPTIKVTYLYKIYTIKKHKQKNQKKEPKKSKKTLRKNTKNF